MSTPTSFNSSVILGRPERRFPCAACDWLDSCERPAIHVVDVHHLAQPIDREDATLRLNKPEPHGFWLVKNWVAFVGCPSPPSGHGSRAEAVHSHAQVRGHRARPYPSRGAPSPTCSSLACRPPNRPQPSAAKAHLSVQIAPNPYEIHQSDLCP